MRGFRGKAAGVAAIVVALAASAFGCKQKPGAPPGPPSAAQLPNILLISIDSLRADHVGCYGYGRATSPNLDRFAAEAVRFTRAYANAPWTLPSHVTMFTGQEVGVHGVDSTSMSLAANATTIAGTLRARGYRTAAVVTAPILQARYGLNQGFDSYDDLSADDYDSSSTPKTANFAVDHALQAIRAANGKPWFVFLHLFDVHHDYLPPSPYDQLFVDPSYRGHFELANWNRQTGFRLGMSPDDFAYVLAEYDGDIAWTDAQIGRLFDELKKSGDWPRTAVIATSDHGEEFLEHGGKVHGATLYREVLDVPLIAKLPRAAPATTVDALVSLADIFATIVELSGGSLAAYRGSGRSLLPLIRRPAAAAPDRPVFAETSFLDRWRIEGAPAIPPGHAAAVQKGGWKYIERFDPPERQTLFHLDADPREQDNKLAEEPAKAEELRTLLHKRLRANHALHDAWQWAGERPLDEKTIKKLKQLGYIN